MLKRMRQIRGGFEHHIVEMLVIRTFELVFVIIQLDLHCRHWPQVPATSHVCRQGRATYAETEKERVRWHANFVDELKHYQAAA